MPRLSRGGKAYKPVRIVVAKGTPQPKLVEAQTKQGRFKKASPVKKAKVRPDLAPDADRFKGKF